MTTTRMRKIVKIDEEKCNGCGDCVPSCAEGAIKIIDGKARLVADNLCDGLGACLGHCPMDAITVEERPAEEFDHDAVKKHVGAAAPAASAPTFTPMMTPMQPMARPGQVSPQRTAAVVRVRGCGPLSQLLRGRRPRRRERRRRFGNGRSNWRFCQRQARYGRIRMC